MTQLPHSEGCSGVMIELKDGQNIVVECSSPVSRISEIILSCERSALTDSNDRNTANPVSPNNGLVSCPDETKLSPKPTQKANQPPLYPAVKKYTSGRSVIDWNTVKAALLEVDKYLGGKAGLIALPQSQKKWMSKLFREDPTFLDSLVKIASQTHSDYHKDGRYDLSWLLGFGGTNIQSLLSGTLTKAKPVAAWEVGKQMSGKDAGDVFSD